MYPRNLDYKNTKPHCNGHGSFLVPGTSTLLIRNQVYITLQILGSDLPVVVPVYRIFCRITTDEIVRRLKWMRIIPTLHHVR